MVYELLLIQDGGMSIPHGHFKRIKPSRSGPRPLSCHSCSGLFASDKDQNSQCWPYSKHHDLKSARQVPSSSLILPKFPACSTSILRTCQVVHFEALPILYTKNAFCFSDPATASDFLWYVDSTHAGLIQEIVIRFYSPIARDRDIWLEYAAKKSGLVQDFPHLRRMTVDLEWRCV